jgi:hypothetical protein
MTCTDGTEVIARSYPCIRTGGLDYGISINGIRVAPQKTLSYEELLFLQNWLAIAIPHIRDAIAMTETLREMT